MKKIVGICLAVLLCMSMTACKTATVPESFSRGALAADGMSYANAFSGVTFTLPDETWYFSSDADLETTMGLDEGTLSQSDAELAQLYAKTPDVVGFLAHQPDTGTTVIYILDNLGVSKYAGVSTDLNGYLKGIARDRLKAEGGGSYEFGEPEACTYNEFEAAYMDATITGYDAYQRYIAYREGDIMYCIIVTTLDTADFDVAEAAFGKM